MRNLSILALVSGLLTSACVSVDTAENGGTGDLETTTTSATEEQTTSTAAATTTTSGNTTTTAPAETTTSDPEGTATTSGGSNGIDDCAVGSWVLDNESFVENFATIFAEAGMPDAEVSALDGTFTVELGADGSLSGTRDGWGFAIDTGEGDVTIEVNGTETGTWSADGSMFYAENETSDIEVESSVEVGGQVIEVPQGELPIETPAVVSSTSDYTCSADTLTMTNSGVESILTRQ